jgi:membrane protease subunit HflC
MKTRYVIVLALLLPLVVALSNAFYVVQANEYGVLLRFGKVVDAGVQPGLHLMIPLADDVHKLDARVQVSDGESTVFGTADKQALVLDSYALWRIVDPRKYYAATGGSSHETETLLLPLLHDALGEALAGHNLRDVLVSGQAPSLARVTPQLDAAARQQLGISVLDLHLRRVRYPDRMLDAVYQRMETTFQSQAETIRAEGKAAADVLLANAGNDRRSIVADATRQADTLRGEGDGQAAAILARTVGADQEFYRFFRSLAAYRASFSKPGDVLILRADDDFLKYLKAPASK